MGAGVVLDVFQAMTILSNVLYALPAVMCLVYGMYVHAATLLFVLLASTLYHMCQTSSGYCIASFDVMLSIDSSFAITGVFLFCVLLVYFLVDINIGVELAIVMVFHVCVTVLIFVTGNLFSPASLGFIVVYTLVTVATLVWLYWHRDRKIGLAFVNRVAVVPYVLGVLCSAISIVFYYLPEMVGYASYPVFHTMWHVFTAIGITFVMYSIRPRQPKTSVTI